MSSNSQHEIRIRAIYEDLMKQGLVKSERTIDAFATKSKKKIGTLDKAFGKMRGGINKLGSKLVSATAVMVGFAAATAAVGKGTQIFIANQKALAEVATISPEVAANIDGIGESVADLALQFGVAEAEVSKGLYQTISSGVTDPRDALMTLNVALGLSKAGLADTTDTTDLLVSTMNAFGFSGAEATRVADVMFDTVKRGKTTIGELAQSMSQVTPAAAALGVSLEQTNAAVATITLSGAPTAEAVTQVHSAMTALLKKSKDVNIALSEAGSSGKGFDLVRLRAEGLVPILADLRKRFAGNEEELTQLLGLQEATMAVFNLTGDNLKVYNDILADVTDSTGSYNEALQTIGATMGFQLDASIEGVKQGLASLGEAFLKGVLGKDGMVLSLDTAKGSADALKQAFEDAAKAVEPMAALLASTASNIVITAESGDARGATVLLSQIATSTRLLEENSAATKARGVSVENLIGLNAALAEKYSSLSNVTRDVIGVTDSMVERQTALADALARVTDKGLTEQFSTAFSAGEVGMTTTSVNKFVDSLTLAGDQMIAGGKVLDEYAAKQEQLRKSLEAIDFDWSRYSDSLFSTALATDGLTEATLGGVRSKEAEARALETVNRFLSEHAALIAADQAVIDAGVTANPSFNPFAGNPNVGPTGPLPDQVAAGPGGPAPISDSAVQAFMDSGGFVPEAPPAKGAEKAWADLAAQIADTDAQQEAFTNRAIDGFSFGLTDAITSAATGVKSLKDAFGEFAASFLADIGRMIIQQMVFNAVSSIFGGGGTAGANGGPIGQLQPMANGGVLGGASPSMIGYAGGGPIVTKPHVALIGEGVHNEAVVPMPGGREIPVNLRGGGSMGAEVSINITSMDGQDAQRVFVKNKASIRTIIQEALGTNQGFRSAIKGVR